MQSDRAEGGDNAQRKLIELARKRLERFVTFLAKFFVNDDPDTIHDLRVWSRRLQQTLRVIVQDQTPAGRKLSRGLRRIRKTLGSCRNIDVNLELVKLRLERAQSPAQKDGWEAVAADLGRMREARLADARKNIAEHDPMLFIERARIFLGRADCAADPRAKLRAAAVRSLTEWDESYALAKKNRSRKQYHALRLATKRLRYRAEIVSDAGMLTAKPMVKDLKEIQSALGDWHDRCVLFECVKDFVARAKFGAKYRGIGNALLGQIEEEQKDNAKAVEGILLRAAKLRKRWHNRRAGKTTVPRR